MIQCDDPFLYRHLEGNAIRRYGDYFLCLLAPQQVMERDLSMKEIIDVYRQGIKDPAIMDKNCTIGKKGYLLSYHVRNILGISSFVQPDILRNAKIVVGVYHDRMITVWNGKIIYVSRGTETPAMDEVRTIAGLKWIA